MIRGSVSSRGLLCRTNDRRQKTLLVQTPEGIVFPLRIASPLRRFLAVVIDMVLVAIAVALIGIGSRLLGIVAADLIGAFGLLAAYAATIMYPMLFEWLWQGQTVGKRIMHLRVMDARGLKLHFGQVVVRNLLRFLDQLPTGFYLFGGICSTLSARGQRIGDIAANTIVVHHARIKEPDLDQVLQEKYNSLRDYPHLCARLRQSVSPREAGLALEALVRRETLDDEARLRLFASLRSHLEALVSFPPEATEGLSDEQMVRNMVDILFRR